MSYSVKRLDSAYINCDKSILFKNGKLGETLLIGCFAWLLKNDETEELLLIDAGINNIDAVNMTKKGKDFRVRGKNGKTVKEHLVAQNINIKNIKNIVITHAHYDHISGIVDFPEADIYLSRSEYEFAVNNESKVFDDIRTVLQSKKKQGKIIFIEDFYDISSNIKLIAVGGHTNGSIIIEVQDATQKFVFTGDAVFLKENLETNTPIGFSQNDNASLEVLNTIDSNAVVLTGHDLSCMEEIYV